MATPPPPPSTTTSHHVMTKIVFLQKILPFGATKKESCAIFKSVSSSWEETVLNYSGAVLCLKAFIESEQTKLNVLYAKSENNTETRTEFGLQTLSAFLHPYVSFPSYPVPIWVIEAVIDVCDLLKLKLQARTEDQFSDKRKKLSGLLSLDRTHPRKLIQLFNKILKLFCDHDGNIFANEVNGTEQDATNSRLLLRTIINNILGDTSLPRAAQTEFADEYLLLLVSTLRRLGGGQTKTNDLEWHLNSSLTKYPDSILDTALCFGRRGNLIFFVETILAFDEGKGEGRTLFLNMCSKTNSSRESLLSAACRYSDEMTNRNPECAQQIIDGIKYLMEKIRSVGGDEEVKKQLQLRFTNTVGIFRLWEAIGHDATTLEDEEMPCWLERLNGCSSIHFACKFGSLEMLQYVLDLAKGFGDEYLKQVLSLRGGPWWWIVDMAKHLPLYYLLARGPTAAFSRETLNRMINLFVEHLLLVGRDFVLHQAWEIQSKTELFSDTKFSVQENIRHFKLCFIEFGESNLRTNNSLMTMPTRSSEDISNNDDVVKNYDETEDNEEEEEEGEEYVFFDDGEEDHDSVRDQAIFNANIKKQKQDADLLQL